MSVLRVKAGMADREYELSIEEELGEFGFRKYLGHKISPPYDFPLHKPAALLFGACLAQRQDFCPIFLETQVVQ